jgi:lysine 2,3-aminomutase
MPDAPSDFVTNPARLQFRDRHFPLCTDTQWSDWRWQMRNRFKNENDFATLLSLSKAERSALREQTRFSSGVTPYYASLLTCESLRRTIVPNVAEFAISHGDSLDPLAEDEHSPVPGVIHRYPDRGRGWLVAMQTSN